MAKATERRGRGRPATGLGVLVGVRCQPDFLARIDSWRGSQPVPPTRPQAIMQLATLGLALKPPKRGR